MKTFVLLALSIVLLGTLFCPMVMAGPGSMPSDLQMVEPDCLAKRIIGFLGGNGTMLRGVTGI